MEHLSQFTQQQHLQQEDQVVLEKVLVFLLQVLLLCMEHLSQFTPLMVVTEQSSLTELEAFKTTTLLRDCTSGCHGSSTQLFMTSVLDLARSPLLLDQRISRWSIFL